MGEFHLNDIANANDPVTKKLMQLPPTTSWPCWSMSTTPPLTC